ncbi:sigma-70 region 4 domain-containing protein [Streptococcus suis]|nr:sigma-70 region 4 domain-containing protein [Streptococcus suis]NQI92762.1 sigma-70 region 4 domain-containing protein [Streptococcus suis]NQJ00611.1 sigma-70 region 4 domain-containing protein [Streptococcus suis]HEM4248729.1 sigma-70 region 4 domain-containing protein [Streptococcus suis]HEM4402386.1 sigma-70 region 4 domain-containing protein [Streptococcus suis]
MTPEQKESIMTLRADGLGYKAIATRLSISVNSVKSFCKRQKVSQPEKNNQECELCSHSFGVESKANNKRFCSNECRMKWWNRNKGNIRRVSQVEHSCQYCQKKFKAYLHERRKFCSHQCYIKERFW